MTAVHHGSGGIQRGQKEPLITVEFQRIHGAPASEIMQSAETMA
jgi:hypothetical protein